MKSLMRELRFLITEEVFDVSKPDKAGKYDYYFY
jgi:hypothetical protein